jgi:hypothetical protein
MKLKHSFPLLLKLASYFYPITIEKSNEPYYLELVLSKNKLILNSKNANQSNEGLKQAFHQAFHQLGVYKKTYKNILVLGLRTRECRRTSTSEKLHRKYHGL